MYMPNYDAVFVPQQEFQPHALPAIQGLTNILPFQPPRRRRPILAVLDLLQKRYSLLADNPAQTTNLGTKIGEANNEHSPSDLLTSTENINENKNNKDELVDSKPEENPNEQTNKTVQTSSDPNHTKTATGSSEVKRISQVNRIYSLLDSLTKDNSNVNDGFSYVFKYRVPPSSNPDKIEDSVKKSLRKIPQIAEDPLRNRVLKTAIDYRKVQSKLDTLLEESAKSEVPIHLNTPGAFGPILLNEYLDKVPDDGKEPDPVVAEIAESQKQKPTKFMLRPVAKAVAGPKGIAVASPIARAVLRRGQSVILEYDPDAVAIAGPGGSAHAHPEFTVDYIDSKESEKSGQGLRSQGPVQSLAYYGGAKGQFLLIHPGGQRTISRSPPPLRAREEEDVGMATEEGDDGDNESVAINPPPDNASVAEAKPVGLAIAGPGGVASSKPVAQAIVGPGGLAVARPIATAIAGVKGGGVPGAIAVGSSKDQQEAVAAKLKQVFFDPETNQLHLTPVHGQRYLFPVNLY